jgi:NAD(P)-dependent dehydrogenase (short-subunit alcohol dehydrogenase family)
MKKNIIITGSTGNLGKVSISKFLSEGYRVHALVSKKIGTEISDDLITYEADLTNENSAHEIISGIIREFHTIDAALLLVGGYASGTIANTGSELLKRMISLNFETAYHVAQPVFNQMTTQPEGGRIIFVGSRPALVASDGKNSLAYALSKSLIFKLAEILNAEGKSTNVVSSVIVPSTIDTPENRKAMPNANFSDWVTMDEIVDSIAFLISAKASALRDPVLKLYGKA